MVTPWANRVERTAVGASAARRRSRLAVVAALLLLELGVGVDGSATASGPPPAAGYSEYQVKAAFLYNFVKFVTWPGEAERDSRSLVLCVLGPDPFALSLERVVEGKSVRGRRLLIRRVSFLDEVGDCDLLFVSEPLAHDPRELLAAVRGRGILTVADSGDFARRGGTIELVERGNRIAFEINSAAARREGLVVSSKLLRLATVVGE